MDSTNSSPRPKKAQLATITDAGNRAEMNPSVILKNLNYGNAEEMKENVNTMTRRSGRRTSLRRSCNSSSLKLTGGSKTPSRSGRQTNKQNYSQFFFSSDEEEENKGVTRKMEDNEGELRKPVRKSTGRAVHKEDPSIVEDSALEPQTKSASKVQESEAVWKHKSLQESPKRKKDESDSDTITNRKRRTRVSMRRCLISDDETTDTQEAATPKETSRSNLRTRRSAKRAGTGDATCSPLLAVPGKEDSSNGEDYAPIGDLIPRATTTPKSTKKGRHIRSRKSELHSLESRKTSEEEDSEVNVGRSTRPRLSMARRSRITSNDEDSDFLPQGYWERMPKSSQTPRSKRTKTPIAGYLDNDGEQLSDVECDSMAKKTPSRRGRTPRKKSPVKTPRNLKPSMPERMSSIADTGSTLDAIRANLHVSAVPKSLPCREKEFKDIYCFVGGKINDSAGGCMYISGMPGTGKTATVHAVVRHLEKDVAAGKLSPFQYVEVNGLRLTEPRQVFVRILQQLTGEKCTPQHAQEILAKKFTSTRGFNKAVLLLVDEVDMLRNRRQDVVYNLFDWPSKAHSKLIVLTIANTMDLPERLLMGRVTSRLGLTRLTFQPYNYKQLQEIVTARLQGSKCFNPDAVQLVARKVAAVSGDARRALDICRRATELLSSDNESVSMAVVNNALTQMMNSASIKTLKACSRMEQLFLQAVIAETKRTGVEETNFNSVYRQFKDICTLDCIRVPNVSQSLSIVNRLGSSRILLTEHGRADIMQTINLNVNSDDIHYAMTKPVAA